MPFTPLYFLRGQQPTRTSNWAKNPVFLHDTLKRSFGLEFYYDGQDFYNSQKYPPHDNQRHNEPTLYHPPPHYHLFSDEYFYITSGAGTWHLWNKSIQLSKGDSICVPTRTWHWFEGDASSEEPLTIAVKYDKGQAAMEERFFRNTLGYLADCRREGLGPSVFQLMIFFMYDEMTPGLRIVPFELLNLLLNALLMYILGGVGLLMGYRVSYPEYYRLCIKDE